MKMPMSVTDAHKAIALGHQTIEGLRDLPPISGDLLQKIGDRPIWDEMMQAGFLSKIQRDRMVDANGMTLQAFLTKELHGRPMRSAGYLQWKIRLVELAGPRLMLDVGNFIRANYGFAPDSLPLENESSAFGAPEQALDVSEIDACLNKGLLHPISGLELKLSVNVQKSLTEHGISSVGDFLVLSNTHFNDVVGISAVVCKKIERAIEARIGLSKTALRKTPTMIEAVKWKYAVMKARQIPEDGAKN